MITCGCPEGGIDGWWFGGVGFVRMGCVGLLAGAGFERGRHGEETECVGRIVEGSGESECKVHFGSAVVWTVFAQRRRGAGAEAETCERAEEEVRCQGMIEHIG